ncbi:N-acetyl-gamma-glutamyl-phosphate reductase [Seinonella peptonophila]|uniref:N-acetyl-gamma-glutamyl-phosphate reductase n=1 Tax=Seinonella peptonophila TaxID=112248 RepID=A0A1M4XRE1_9BACL|nr:N-acetyl-gamma-glutamyl-phosphate reductase [Seinonella peptonophila]SHE95812.1 N-acetyl-gamma-glutamyl-phosphate reductase [Seinonella peptonophila]
MKAVIIGATGYGGLELIRLLQSHPQIDALSCVSTSQSGEAIAKIYPHLTHMKSRLEALEIDQLVQGDELIFFATPHGVSSQLAPSFIEKGCVVIDLSGDFRLPGDEYRQWYQREPAPPQWQKKSIYGLTEWVDDTILDASLIANPGCFATASLLAILPLLKHQLIEPRLVIDGKTGVSGAGRTADATFIFSELNENIRPYRVVGHQHIPEMERYAKLFSGQPEVLITFTPHLVPMTRGMIVTIYAHVRPEYQAFDFNEVYQTYYEKSPFIRLFPNGFPQSKHVQGSNFCDIGWSFDQRTNQLIIIAAIDNLVKGAAGQAIQNANLRFGYPQESGLLFSPLSP